MAEFIIPSALLGLVLAGSSILWVSRIIKQNSSVGQSGTWMLVSVFGWMMLIGGILGGTVGMFVFPHILSVVVICTLLVLIGIVLLMAVGRYVLAERTSLLWTLAVAAESGIPLGEAAHAFADERMDGIGQRARRLGMLLDAGMDLPSAMMHAGHHLTVDSKLAIEMGTAMNMLGPTLRYAVEGAEESQEAIRSVLEKLFYLIVVMFVLTLIFVFLMVKIVPVFQRMFSEFGLDLPAISEFIIGFGERVGPVLALSIPFLLLMFAGSFMGFLQYIGLLPRDLPGLVFFTRRLDGARVLKALSITAQRGRTLSETLRFLSVHFPKQAVRRLIVRAGEMVNDGVHWCDALSQVGLIQVNDAVVLRSAERVGNLGWALNEMGDSAIRRSAYRLRFWMNLIFPIMMFAVGLTILVVLVAIFLPLVSLIEGLS